MGDDDDDDNRIHGNDGKAKNQPRNLKKKHFGVYGTLRGASALPCA